VQGGGLSTIISSENTQQAGIVMTGGKLMLVVVTSSGHSGLDIRTSTATNCIFYNCRYAGVDVYGIGAKVINCIFWNNNGAGFYCNGTGASLFATNCIAVWNKDHGFYNAYNTGETLITRYCNSFGNSLTNYNTTSNNIECKSVDPGFSQDAWRLSNSSLLKDTDDPNIHDLEGTRSDMGYYGGPDAPLLPYITFPQNYKLNSDGTIQFDMQGKVGY
jgi:hypothetical protein